MRGKAVADLKFQSPECNGPWTGDALRDDTIVDFSRRRGWIWKMKKDMDGTVRSRDRNSSETIR